MEKEIKIFGRKLKFVVKRHFDSESSPISGLANPNVDFPLTEESLNLRTKRAQRNEVETYEGNRKQPREEAPERLKGLNSVEIEEMAQAAIRELKAMADQARQELSSDLWDTEKTRPNSMSETSENSAIP